MSKGIILDRDGTLVDVVRDEETGVITTAFHPSQLRLMPGVIEGLRELSKAGFLLSIATNQPGPAKGHFSAKAVEATNAALVEMLAKESVQIAHVAVCMHHPSVGPCDCRKPKPGMLNEIIDALKLDRATSWIVGDTTTDALAGNAARVKTGLLFDTKRCELCPLRNGPSVKADAHAASFADLARLIIAA